MISNLHHHKSFLNQLVSKFIENLQKRNFFIEKTFTFSENVNSTTYELLFIPVAFWKGRTIVDMFDIQKWRCCM